MTKLIVEMEMPQACPCEKCPTRIIYAVLFDIHISGEDCPYPCDKWEQYKQKGANDADN